MATEAVGMAPNSLIQNEKALRGHPEGFLGGLTSLSIDRVKSSKD
ncbi:hypothetical protein GA0061098_1011152 [Bradyrhizobium shewense]|uniref:Uncharacterized protein n=1 Tax=Bradyrhizobium shewense TaxID=1761772 RepID=A0A1C3X241_9BRAD|nr:hypothetical protein GA0061098_1011152 [Bradyrhizobium shewense]